MRENGLETSLNYSRLSATHSVAHSSSREGVKSCGVFPELNHQSELVQHKHCGLKRCPWAYTEMRHQKHRREEHNNKSVWCKDTASLGTCRLKHKVGNRWNFIILTSANPHKEATRWPTWSDEQSLLLSPQRMKTSYSSPKYGIISLHICSHAEWRSTQEDLAADKDGGLLDVDDVSWKVLILADEH